jgi:transposase InsO family protein
MPWQEQSTMSLRREFAELARQPDANIRALCRRFQISPKTAYKWLGRFSEAPSESQSDALSDRSRRPHGQPRRSLPELETAVVELRRAHPAWGGRKIARRLLDTLGLTVAPSTVTAILHRHDLIRPEASTAAQRWLRFEHAAPNALWQIDFKGHFQTPAGKCYTLTLLDDHSRFNLTIRACARTDADSIQPLLGEVFRRYGLPVRINADNGAPWGSPSLAEHGLSRLSVWLIRQGVRVSHSTPYHPQTNGKLERFHRSLEAEVLAGRNFADLGSAQQAFDHWRTVYNCERPHEALRLDTPVQRYQPSHIAYKERLSPIEYPETDEVLTVGWNGFVKFRGRNIRLSNALHRLPVGIRPAPGQDGCFDVYFCHQRFMRLDMRQFKEQA